jgi:hypothetical protein
MNYFGLSQLKLGWIAGIIDGEGTIYIGAYSRNKKTGVPHYQTHISVSSTDEIMVDWLLENCGGAKRVYTPKQTPKNSRSIVYRWTLWANLDQFCKAIMEGLVVKKRQAQIMIEMRATFDSQYSNRRKISKAIPEDIMALRRSLYLELKSLHIRNLKNKPCAVLPT